MGAGPLIEPEPIYLDNHATTPVDPRVVDIVSQALSTNYGNPNSVDHAFGATARRVLEEACAEVALLVGANPSSVTLTSGATEAIRLAILHARLTRAPSRPLRVVVSPIEHRAVLYMLGGLERKGAAELRWLEVDHLGQIDLDEVRRLSVGADLICLMAANNEIGTIYPIESVASVASTVGAACLVDATQAAGKIPVDVNGWGVTYLTLSAHKMYGPKGTGALVLGPGVRWRQEKHGGTPNVPAIAGLAEAARIRRLEMACDERRIGEMRDRLEVMLRAGIPGLVVNGDPSARLSGNLHISVPGVPSDPVLARLHDRVALSSGSACMSGAPAPSHVLVAIGLGEELVDGALRIGVGKFNTDPEIERAGELIAETVASVRALTAPFAV